MLSAPQTLLSYIIRPQMCFIANLKKAIQKIDFYSIF